MISIDFTSVVIAVLVFGLVFVLKNYFFEPVACAMEERQRKIEEAEYKWTDVQTAIETAREQLSDAVQMERNKGYELLEGARVDAQKQAQVALDKERAQIQKQTTDAKERLSKEADQAVLNLEKDAEIMAAQVVSRILGREVV